MVTVSSKLFAQATLSPYAVAATFAVCKVNLRGRLVLNEGDKPYSSRISLQSCRIYGTLMGRGYYEFSFSSYDDLRIVWPTGTINLKPVCCIYLNGLRILTLTRNGRHIQRFGFDCGNCHRNIGWRELCLKSQGLLGDRY